MCGVIGRLRFRAGEGTALHHAGLMSVIIVGNFLNDVLRLLKTLREAGRRLSISCVTLAFRATTALQHWPG
jgi:hypothetical protein